MVVIVTRQCDRLFEILDFGAHKNAFNFTLALCLLNIGLSTYPLVCYYAYSTDPHVVFWVGNGPQVVNIGVPCVLLFLNVAIHVLQFAKAAPGAMQIKCFLLFCIMGGLLVGGGIWVAMATDSAADDLMRHCGETPMTQKIEGEWARLNVFAQQCAKKQKQWPDFITKCPGFSKAFPNRVYANYIEDLEYDFDCTGFCRFWAKPLFNIEAERGKRCASELAHKITLSGNAVSGPTILLGIGLIVAGSCFAAYDHL